MIERALSAPSRRSLPLMGRFALLSVGVWLYAADTLVTATISPGIVVDIGGIAYLNWTVSLYEVGAIIAGAAAGMLCGRFGIKRTLSAAAVLYTLGCAIAALAPSMPVVVTGRWVQGLGGGMMLSLCYLAMYEWFPEQVWNRLFALEAALWAAGSLLGPMIGGLFVNRYSWRGAFWFFGVQSAVLLLAVLGLPADAPTLRGPARWPFPTLALLSAATLMIASAGIARRPAMAATLCLVGVGVLYLAARVDRSASVQLLPPDLLNLDRPVGAGLLMVLALSIATIGFWLYGPLILKILFGTNPVIAGYILAGEALAWSLVTLLVSATGPHSETALIRIGVSVISTGGAGYALAVPGGAMAAIVSCALMQGIGFGLCWPEILRRLVRAADPSERSLVSASQSIVQRIGFAVGTAAVGIAANLSGLGSGVSVAAAKAAGFWVFAAFIPIFMFALFAAWRFTRGSSQQ